MKEHGGVLVKLLFVAVFNGQSTNDWQSKGFVNLGHEVIEYNYRHRASKIGRSKRDSEIIKVCNEEKPDFVLFSKCNLVNIRVILECNKICQTVLWYMDFRTLIDDELRQKMQHCTHVFCSRWDGIEEAVKFNKNVHRLQGGYDPDLHYPMDVPYTRDVCFIGDKKSDRVKYTDYVDFVTGVYGKEHSKTVSSTKINLNFNEGDGTSNRIYKLLAARGFVLTQPWKKMDEDWEPGKDFVTFDSPSDLKEKIAYYLEHEEEREKIAKHGNLKNQKYDHNNYARKIVTEVGRYKNPLDIRDISIIDALPSYEYDKVLLNVGAGKGRIDNYLSNIGHRVYATDIVAHTNWEDVGSLTFHEDVDIFNVDSFPIQKASVVLCSQVLEHLPDYAKAIANLLKLATVRLIITVPYKHSFGCKDHCNVWDDTNVSKFIELTKPYSTSISKIRTKKRDVELKQWAYLIIVDKRQDR